MKLAVAGLGIGLLFAGCSAEPQLSVRVHSDETPVAGDRLEIDVSTNNGFRAVQTIDLENARFPASFGIATKALSDVTDLSMRLTYRFADGMEKQTTRNLIGISNAGRQYVDLCLPSTCNQLSCPTGSACGRDGCVSERIQVGQAFRDNFSCGQIDLIDGGSPDVGPQDVPMQDAVDMPDAPNDAGPADSNLEDAEPADVNRSDAGNPDWPAPSFAHRLPIVLSANNVTGDLPEGLVVRVQFDHQNLTFATGFSTPARPDGGDLQLQFADTVVPFSLEAGSSFDATDTRIMFRLPVAIPAGADAEFHMYFGNPLQSRRLENDVPNRRVIHNLQTNSRSTTSDVFVPAVTDTLPASLPTERWLVSVSWKSMRQNSGPRTDLGTTRLEVDGVEVAELSGATYGQGTQSFKVQSIFHVVPGDPSEQTVEFAYASSVVGHPVRIESARLTAMLLPATALEDAVPDEVSEPANGLETEYSTVTLPSTGGPWVWFAGGLVSQVEASPGGHVAMRAVASSAVGDPAIYHRMQERLLRSPDLFSPMFSVGVVPSSLSEVAITSETTVTAGAVHKGLRQLVVPTSSFEAVADSFDPTELTQASPTTNPQATLPDLSHPTGALRDYAYYFSATGDYAGTSFGSEVRFGIFPGEQFEAMRTELPSMPSTISYMFTETATRSARLSFGADAINANRPAVTSNRSWVGIRLKDPVVTTAPAENR